MTGPHPLDNPVRSSLAGPHARLAQRRGRVLCYPADVSPFFGLPDRMDDADWADLAVLAGPGASVAVAGTPPRPPGDWTVTSIGAGVQLVDVGVDAAPVGSVGSDGSDGSDDKIVRLGSLEVPEMLDLVARTNPGPFLPRTVEMGAYLGIRRGGALVAMAGERMHPPGWTEISAVCTDERWRGHGFATLLIRALVAEIRARGETPFLHALATNPAIKLYEALGFRLRRATEFTALGVPGGTPGGTPGRGSA